MYNIWHKQRGKFMELINKNIVNNRYFKVVDKVIRDILHKRKKDTVYEAFKSHLIFLGESIMKNYLEETGLVKDERFKKIRFSSGKLPGKILGSHYEGNIVIDEKVIEGLYNGKLEMLEVFFHELNHFKIYCDIEVGTPNICLYRILKDLHSLQELLDYMKGDVLIRKAYRSQVAFEVARSINVLSPQSSNENKFYYDKNISFNKKIQILQEYLSGLQFRLVETKSLEKIKEEIYLLKGMQEDELQQSLIIKKENQLEEAKRNTEVFKELCQLSQYRVDDEKIFTKRR